MNTFNVKPVKESEKSSTQEKKTKRVALQYHLRIRCEHRDLDEGASTSTCSASSSKKAKSKTQNWRQKVKETNPEKYKQMQQNAREYSQLYRLECSTSEHTLKKRNLSSSEKEEAEKWVERKKKSNETARNRMNKMNNKRRLEQATKAKKVITRQAADMVRKKEAQKKRNQRAKWTPERKEVVNARRRELRALNNKSIKKRILDEERRKLKEMEEQVKALEVELQNKQDELLNRHEQLTEANSMLPDNEVIDARSKTAQRKALQRVRSCLPKRRSHNISTTIQLVNASSPRKAAALEKAGITANNKLHEGVMQAVADGLSAPRKSSKRKYMAIVLSAIKKQKQQRAAARRFGCSRKLLSNAKKRSAGRRGTSLETIQLIRDFYEATSNPLPEKKLVSKKTNKPRHIMEFTIAQLYTKYTKAHPENPVGASVFYLHRPTHVKTKAQAKYTGCLCEYCENIRLKIQAINKLQPGTFKDGYDLVHGTMCSKPNGWEFHQPGCIRRTCKKCGPGMLIKKLCQLLSKPERPTSWLRWELVKTSYHGKKGTKEITKRKPVTKEGNVGQLITELREETHPFAEHLFNKDFQNLQEKDLIKKLRPDEAFGIFDFAENYKCAHQCEMQSAYYAQDSATVHPIVTYYQCPECHNHVRESVVMISNDLTHDYHSVHSFHERLSEHLTQTRGLKINTFYRFSDGASSQYKSKGPISDISYGVQDFGYIIHHNFSGSRHGKGLSDGESGVVKRMASDAVKVGTAIISTAKDLYMYLKEKATIEASHDRCCIPFRRSVFFVESKDICRERPHRIVRTVKGTRKFHSVKTITTRGGRVGTRNLSCFCDPCIRGIGSPCKNATYVSPWKEVTLHIKKAQKTTSENIDQDSNNDIPQQPSSTHTDECPESTSVPLNHDNSAHPTEVEVVAPPPGDNIKGRANSRTTIGIQDFVAVRVTSTGRKVRSEELHVAQVASVPQDGSYSLSYMIKAKGSNQYTWPQGDEVFFLQPITDIVAKLDAPQPVAVGSRLFFKFNLKDAEELFNAK